MRLHILFVSAAVCSTALLFTPSQLYSAEFGRDKIAQWGDPFTAPQTRTRCVSYAWGSWPWGGGWKTCNGWATDVRTMQVVVYAKTLGPDNLAKEAQSAVEAAVKVCAALAGGSALTALTATPSPEVASRIAAAYGAASSAFVACIGKKSSELTAVGVGTSSLKLAFDTETHWSKWSNE